MPNRHNLTQILKISKQESFWTYDERYSVAIEDKYVGLLIIVGPKCTLATLHAWLVIVSMPTGQTDRQTDGWTPDRFR